MALELFYFKLLGGGALKPGYSGIPFCHQTTSTSGALRFSDLRNDWLAGGDVARSSQTNYTVRVERIPRAFRSPAMLQKFFSTLFPGQVRAEEDDHFRTESLGFCGESLT